MVRKSSKSYIQSAALYVPKLATITENMPMTTFDDKATCSKVTALEKFSGKKVQVQQPCLYIVDIFENFSLTDNGS